MVHGTPLHKTPTQQISLVHCSAVKYSRNSRVLCTEKKEGNRHIYCYYRVGLDLSLSIIIPGPGFVSTSPDSSSNIVTIFGPSSSCKIYSTFLAPRHLCLRG